MLLSGEKINKYKKKKILLLVLVSSLFLSYWLGYIGLEKIIMDILLSYFNFVWCVARWLNRCLTSFLLIELLYKYALLIYHIKKKTKLYSLVRPSIPESSSLVGVGAFILNSMTFTIIHKSLCWLYFNNTLVENINNSNKLIYVLNITCVLSQRFIFFIIGFPRRVYLILRTWYTTKPRNVNILIPFAEILDNLNKDKTIIFIHGVVYLN